MHCKFLVVLSLFWVSGNAAADDWPTYRHDHHRSGNTAEALKLSTLGRQWERRPAVGPRPAWPGPAKWDAYANIRGMHSMRNYDRTFHVIVVGDSLYFGSSGDDSVYCLDARSGQTNWTFCTDGPVRIAPSFAGGKLYFGSDDGRAYCLNAADGKLIWKSKPPADGDLLLNNGRFISRWPCRTGVLVDGGTAYFGLALLPWRDSYLYAVDAKTGEPTGAGRYKQAMYGETLEGALLVSSGKIIAPRGRVAPMLFAQKDGHKIGALTKGGGGSSVSISSQGHILHGPGNKTGWVTVSDPNSRKDIRTHKGFTAMATAGTKSYLLSDTRLAAIEESSGRLLWNTACPKAYELIVAGDVVFVGGRDEVAAYSTVDGRQVWKSAIAGDVLGLAVANGALYASTGKGSITCFRSSPATTTKTDSSSQPKTIKQAAKQPVDESAKPRQPVEIRDDGLTDRWVFHSGMSAVAKRRGLKNAEKRVANLSRGLHATILGESRLWRVGSVEALELDGSTNSVLVTGDHTQARLPQKKISAEAWVRVDQPQKWGGIVGAVQDNGDFERGWLLGFTDSNFSFAIAGKQGPGRMTYLAAETAFREGHWYHVAGTYDGTVQRIYVDGKLEREEKTQHGDIHYPPQAFYELGAYHDKDEYYRLTGMLHEVRVYRRALSAKEVNAHFQAKRKSFPVPILLATGPYAQFTGKHSADVRWRTDAPSPTHLDYTIDGKFKQVVDETPKTEHRVTLSRLNRGRPITYRIHTAKDGKSGSTESFTLESDFNFSVTDIPKTAQPFPADDVAKRYASAAKYILSQAGFDRGICLVLGCAEGRLAYELARQSKLRVIGVDESAAVVNRARQTLQQAGAYGPRITFRQVKSLDRLPFVAGCANLIVSGRPLDDGKPPGTAVEVLRMLRPGGGVAILGQPPRASGKASKIELQRWFAAGSVQAQLTDDESGLWGKVVRSPLAGAGEWTHLYGRADNSAFGGETLGGVSTATGMRVQWIGRPGPRVQPDRNGRKPSPLSVNGRLFVQGLHRLIGLDAYNGTLLWSLEIPSLERFNMPRDSGNWCADQDSVFAAIRDKCWQIDAQTGQVTKFHSVIPGGRPDWKYDWGYLARVGEQFIGSAVKQGTAFTNFWGNADAGWYDARGGPATFKVCSENLFALDRSTGRPNWTYQNGVILNSTITATANRVYFVECRNAQVKASTSRRIGMPELWKDQFLVAIDAATGEIIWEKPLDVAAGITVFYMAYADDKLVISSSNNKHYDVYGFDAADGKRVWHQSIGWLEEKGDHGKAMSRPAIVGGRVYVRPRVFDLKSGKLLAIKMPAGGCGTYAATSNAFIFRSGNITMWDTTSGSSTNWDRLRPGCWLSTIPAGGMLLSPEAGGGCSCGNWLETSIGFMPSR